jgi:hypothetical protein
VPEVMLIAVVALIAVRIAAVLPVRSCRTRYSL